MSSSLPWCIIDSQQLWQLLANYGVSALILGYVFLRYLPARYRDHKEDREKMYQIMHDSQTALRQQQHEDNKALYLLIEKQQSLFLEALAKERHAHLSQQTQLVASNDRLMDRIDRLRETTMLLLDIYQHYETRVPLHPPINPV